MNYFYYHTESESLMIEQSPMKDLPQLIEEISLKQFEKIRKEQGKEIPLGATCPYCDFASDKKGMDRCTKCNGTGSVLHANNKQFPNTEDGYFDAIQELNKGE